MYDRLRAAKNALRKLMGKRVSGLPHGAVRVSCKQGKARSAWEHGARDGQNQPPGLRARYGASGLANPTRPAHRPAHRFANRPTNQHHTVEDLQHWQGVLERIDAERVDGVFCGNLEARPPALGLAATLPPLCCDQGCVLRAPVGPRAQHSWWRQGGGQGSRLRIGLAATAMGDEAVFAYAGTPW